MNSIYFISAIDTDAGKTVVTGELARFLHFKGVKVITQKLSQTGCVEVSEDISEHRRRMGVAAFPEDAEGLTCPYIFPFPCSPHLAASMENCRIEPGRLKAATDQLALRYECVLVEGVGGLMVPLNDDTMLIDYVSECAYPVILVTHAKLGSINHTLLSLDACARRGIVVVGVVFNHYGATSTEITADTLHVFYHQLKYYYPEAILVEVPCLEEHTRIIDFSSMIN